MNENDLYVIGKSVSCSNKIDEIEKVNQKLVTTVYRIGTLSSILIMFGSTILELLNGEKLEYIKGPSMWEWLVGLGVILFSFCVANVRSKKANAVVTKYRQLCSAESLILYNEKIYGTTAEGTVQLEYIQISAVVILTTTDDLNEGTIGNEMLQICDISGHQYNFHSFSNCTELKNIIDLRID